MANCLHNLRLGRSRTLYCNRCSLAGALVLLVCAAAAVLWTGSFFMTSRSGEQLTAVSSASGADASTQQLASAAEPARAEPQSPLPTAEPDASGTDAPVRSRLDPDLFKPPPADLGPETVDIPPPPEDDSWQADITFGIKCFGRLDLANTMARSVQRYFPKAKIILVDDSGKPIPEDQKLPGVRYVEAPFDTGLGGGRNLLVLLTTTKYFAVSDDDFEVTHETNLWGSYWIMETYPHVDLIGGRYKDDIKSNNFIGRLYYKKETSTMHVCQKRHPSDEFQVKGCYWTMKTYNVFLAKKEFLLANPWDSRLKIAEHSAFFLHIADKYGGKKHMLYCNHYKIKHNQVQMENQDPSYRSSRYDRTKDMWDLFAKDHDIKKISHACIDEMPVFHD